jgi:hypothetical protein
MHARLGHLWNARATQAAMPHLPVPPPCRSPAHFLTAPLSSVPVGFPDGPRERRLRCGTRAIRASLHCAPPVQGEAPELWWRPPDASQPGSAPMGAPPPPSA